MTAPELSTQDRVAIAAFVLTAISMLAVPALYVASELHQIEIRMTRIETILATKLGVDEVGIQLGAR